MHFLSRIVLKRSSQLCKVWIFGLDMGVLPLFPFFKSWQVPCVKTSLKCQVLGMVRQVMVGADLAPAPLAFLGLQIPIPLGVPSL